MHLYVRSKAPRGSWQKIVQVMRITALLILLFTFGLHARGLSQKITLSVKNAGLETVFRQLEQQSGYTFLYYSNQLAQAQPVTLQLKDTEFKQALDACFSKLPFSYEIVGQTVVVKEKEKNMIDVMLNVGRGKGGSGAETSPQQQPITGRVLSEDNKPLLGATVRIAKTNVTTFTDRDGRFTLRNVPEGASLSISYVGYETLEVKASDDLTALTLTALASNLDEVIVNKGYYTERKELSTGNVSKVTAKEIGQQPVSDPILSLEGRVSGLYIQQASGIPGAGTIVRLRGQNSLVNGNDPLFIVDGIAFSSMPLGSPTITGGAVGQPGTNYAPGLNPGQGLSPFNNLNPEDIESIEILKDADATAIYGSRGANGVILITTKKGKAGTTLVDANVYSGIGQVTRQMDLLNTSQYLAMRHQAFKNDGQLPGINDYDLNGTWDTTRNTDWQKELFGGTSHFTNAQATVSGGNANVQFLFGGGYSTQGTVYPGDYNDRKTSFHFNLDNTSSNDKFHASLSAQYLNDRNQLPQFDLTTAALYLAPNAPALYDASGNLNWEGGTWNNPLAGLLRKQLQETNNIIGNLALSYEILPGLLIKTNFGYNRVVMNQDSQTPAAYFYGPPIATRRSHQRGDNYYNTIVIEPQINYSRNIGRGKLDVLIGITDQQDHRNSYGITAANFPSDEQIPNISAASSIFIASNIDNKYSYSAIYSRIGYNWEEKYLVNLTARRDGSSRFGPSNQFGDFGSIGAGWIFSKEKFIREHLSFLSFGKLRGSYGISGNDQITDYQYLSLYNFNTSNTYQGVSTIFPNNIGNPYFGWEMVRKLEGGIELGFLNDRIHLNVDYYQHRTANQLVGQPLPTTTGFTTIQANLPAVVQNKGLEFQLNTVNLKSNNFSWTSSVNLTIPKNTLIDFPGLATNPTYVNRYAVGKSIYVRQLLHYTGINPQTGTYTFEDINQDGRFTSAGGDFQFLKQIAQTYYGGLANNLIYKGWQLDFLIQFVKQTGQNYLAYYNPPGLFLDGSQNQPTAVLSAWTATGDNSKIEKYTSNTGSLATNAYLNLKGSDAIISDASFIRLKNVELSYQLPQRWQQGLHLKNVRIYLQAQNLFTITNYLGLDPETQGQSLPPLRMVTTGIQIGL